MKKQAIITAVIALFAASAEASQESRHYLSYFTNDSIQNLMTQTALYNEENGYWERNSIMNQELVRYLNQIEADKSADVAAQRETFGYWR
jgi:hypothetical protein